MLSQTKLILSTVAIVVIISAAAIGWALTTYQPNLEPTPSASTSLPEPTLTQTSSSVASSPPLSPLPSTEMPPVTLNPTLKITPLPSPTAIPTLIPTSAPNSSSTAALPQGNPISNGLKLTVSVAENNYSLGESINLTLKITNITNQTINFTHTGMDFDFAVYNKTGNIIFRWSLGRAFAMFITIQPLPPGRSVTETDVWPQTSNTLSTNEEAVSVGTYFIVGESNPLYGLQTAPIQVDIAGS